ncbi:MAG: hypothetical protein IPK66_00850 [Rhodospirillales bacterium]|nr:hypothetical protein [Rhodospirillales bacterium]
MRDDGGIADARGAPEGPVSIPLFDVTPGVAEGMPASVALMDLAGARLESLMDRGRRHYGEAALAAADWLSSRWLARTGNPYREEIALVAARLGRSGAVMLNMSYEWSCTAGVAFERSTGGMRLRRTLDWPLDGLGRNVIVARQAGTAGAYYSVTWPGYVGVLTGMAPGRFSAAINQPPLRRVTSARRLDWIIARAGVWRSASLPPPHLLRQVFDECRTYEEAKQALIETQLCTAAFFSLVGPKQGCVIERREDGACVHDAPASISNHWIGFPIAGHDKGDDSVGRRARMARALADQEQGLSWVVPPILNWTTRLAVVADTASGELIVQGWEKAAAATTIFKLGQFS